MFSVEITYQDGTSEWLDDWDSLAEAETRMDAALAEDWRDEITEIVIYEKHADGVWRSILHTW